MHLYFYKIITALFLCIVQLTSQAADKTYTVAFAQDRLDNPWRSLQLEELIRGFAKYENIRFIYSDAKGSSSRQISDIENFTRNGVDVLITSPMNSKSSTPAISKAYKAGIPVVLLIRHIENEDYTVHIGPDDVEIGRSAGQAILENTSGNSRVLLLEGTPGTSTTIDRSKGFLETIRPHPSIEVSQHVNADYKLVPALQAVENLLYSNQRFDAIFSGNGRMTIGAIMALERAGLKPELMNIITIGYNKNLREMIRAGKIKATFLYPTCADATVETVRKILSGIRPERKIIIPTTLITQQNVEQVSPLF